MAKQAQDGCRTKGFYGPPGKSHCKGTPVLARSESRERKQVKKKGRDGGNETIIKSENENDSGYITVRGMEQEEGAENWRKTDNVHVLSPYILREKKEK